jgi:radical SAM protein with 4Fe4S-binding SPASM domain
MTNGDVYSCSVFLGNKKFVLGNINYDRFDEIWEGEKRKTNWLAVKKMPIGNCRINCRMDKVNAYLENIKNPPQNYTFI